MQLQEDLPAIRAAGVQLIAISYNTVEELADFAKQRNIEFPLLADAGSKTIKAYGIFREDVEADSYAYGVPYPGTYLLSSDGIVRAKLFYDGYKYRHATTELIDAAKNSD